MRKILLLLFILLLSLPALAGEDWQNYSFRIDGVYSVKKTGPAELFVYRGSEPLRFGGKIGPLWSLAVTDGFIYGKHFGLKDGGPDGSRTLYSIVPRDGSEVSGPLDEGEFLEKAGAMPAWESLRAAHKRALREGSADYGEVDRYLLGQLVFMLKELPWITLYSFLPGSLVGFYLRSKEKKRPFVKGWLWTLCAILSAIFLVALAGWLDLRFL